MSEQGREKRDAKRMLLASGAAAVEVIVSLMQDSGLKPELRLKAAESILDRIGGKSGIYRSLMRSIALQHLHPGGSAL